MDFLLQLVMNGLVVGSIYALVALGFVIIYKSSSILNFAQGEFLMIGAYICLALMVGTRVPFWAAFVLTLGFSVVLGLALERIVLRPMIGEPVISVIMLTLGLSSILRALVQGIWGTDTIPFPQVFPPEPIHLGPFPISQGYMWSVACVAVLLAAFGLFFKYSRAGVAMRATAFSQQVALSMGISVRRIFALSWSIAAVVSAVGGMLLGTIRGGVDGSLSVFGLKVIPVVILGGLDSVMGAIVGGLVIGVLENLSGGYLDPVFGGGVKEVAPFVALVLILIATIAAMGLNILTGFTGQISLGNAAFMAVGAYATAALAGKAGVPFYVAIPLSGAVSALVGMIFGVPSLRLKGLYLAMATLAAHFIIEFTASHWDSMTGGVNGISVPAARLGSLDLANDAKLFYVILPLTVGLTLFARNLFRTRVGKAFVAIRDQDISAEVMGVRVFRYKLLAFAVSSFYVGIAGSLLAYQSHIISPENFPISVAIDQLGMVIIGGLGSVQGAIFGAAFMTVLPELLRIATGSLSDTWPHLTTIFAPLRTGLFGLVIVLFLMFEPDGLAARWRLIKAYWKLYPFSY